ncbi:MAG: hypothetical protein R6V77_00655 [Candidatus Cloacimonadaceae bacterium]
MKKNEFYSVIGFGTGIASLTTIIIPVLSLVMSVLAITFSLLGRKSAHKGFFYAGLGMGTLGLIFSLIYLAVVLAGRA